MQLALPATQKPSNAEVAILVADLVAFCADVDIVGTDADTIAFVGIVTIAARVQLVVTSVHSAEVGTVVGVAGDVANRSI